MKIIEENQNRMPKRIEPGTDKEGEVHFHIFSDIKEEFDTLIKQLKEYKQNRQLNQCAIILRTNQGVEQIKKMLLKEEIPVTGQPKKQEFYEHFIMRDIEDYIRFAKGDRKRERFLHIMNKPSRFISRESVEGTESEVAEFEIIRQYYGENSQMINTLLKLEKDLELLQEMPPFLAVNYIRKAIGYDEYLQELKRKTSGKNTDDYTEIIEKVQKDAATYRSIEEWFEAIEERKNQKMQNRISDLGNRGDVANTETEDAVCVITMHGAKGLEYDKVFLPELNEGTVPYGKMLSREEEEEERRIFYVAVTRAKTQLEFMCVENEREKPSRFLKNIYKKRIRQLPKRKPP